MAVGQQSRTSALLAAALLPGVALVPTAGAARRTDAPGALDAGARLAERSAKKPHVAIRWISNYLAGVPKD